jgi:UDP-N-acetylmuramoylalanine--D-glutamate ligase
LELSSFQLHDTPSVEPAVGILTNLTPDHLDRYSTVDEYYGDKMRLFANATSHSRWVLNGDDAESLARTSGVVGEKLYFSTRGTDASSPTPSAWYDRASNKLVLLGVPLMERDRLPLLGDHNVANALAATLAVASAAEEHQTPEARAALAGALQTFRAPPHRLELVGEWNGVQWINDSKATNVSSTYVAVDGMTRPTILLLGGRHKGEPYTALAKPIQAHVKRVIAYGESAERVEHDLRDIISVDRLGSDFDAVIRHARELAKPGDAVLLSPACSSYDMFNNYEERGARFRELASGGLATEPDMTATAAELGAS